MAIVILGNTGCSLCGEVLVAGQRIVASPHFIQNQSHPLWRYSDSAMHEDCFRQWPHREEFIAEYNRTMEQIAWGNGSRHAMQADGTIATHPAVGRA